MESQSIYSFQTGFFHPAQGLWVSSQFFWESTADCFVLLTVFHCKDVPAKQLSTSFPKWLHHLTFLLAMYTGSFCSSNHPHLALAFLNSCHHFNLVQKRLIVVLIYISLMANYIDPSLPTNLPSDYQFWCCVCSSFLLIFNWVIFFFLPLSLESPLYIQDTNYLVYEQFAHFFFLL